jgi:hypothetical protein
MGTVDYDNGIQYLNGAVDFIKLDNGIARREQTEVTVMNIHTLAVVEIFKISIVITITF